MADYDDYPSSPPKIIDEALDSPLISPQAYPSYQRSRMNWYLHLLYLRKQNSLALKVIEEQLIICKGKYLFMVELMIYCL